MKQDRQPLARDLLERFGIFVTCQIGGDVPYLIKSCMVENTSMIGTDILHRLRGEIAVRSRRPDPESLELRFPKCFNEVIVKRNGT